MSDFARKECASLVLGLEDAATGDQRVCKQLIVDISTLAQNDAGTGIQRVVRAIVMSFQTKDIKNFSVKLVAADRSTSYRYLPEWWVSGRQMDEPLNLCSRKTVHVEEGDVFLGLDFAAAIAPRHEKLLATWKRAGVSLHFLVYDLLPLTNPQWFSLAMRRNFRRWLGLLDRQADQIIAISQYVAGDVEAWRRRWRIGRRRYIDVTTIPLGGDISASSPTQGLPHDAEAIIGWMRNRPTAMMVATIEPRKGHDVVLAAFQRLRRTLGDNAPQLLVVGRPGWKTKHLQARMSRASRSDNAFLWLQDATDEYLDRLYAEAAGVVIASRDEGFGLPLAEAALHRKWVLVRDRPVFREQGLTNVIYFDDDRAEQLAGKLKSLIEASAQCPPPPSTPPTWEECAQRLLEHVDAIATPPNRNVATRVVL